METNTTQASKKTTRKKASAPEMLLEQSNDVREEVAVRAYFLAEQAGFDAGRELDFWLQAESETLAARLGEAVPEKPKRVRKPREKKAE